VWSRWVRRWSSVRPPDLWFRVYFKLWAPDSLRISAPNSAQILYIRSVLESTFIVPIQFQKNTFVRIQF
jgi:hypothetical protein